MEISVLVVSNRSSSLRKAICNDLRRPHPVLVLDSAKSIRRSPGWAKVRGAYKDELPGVVNFEWDQKTRTLTVRAIAEKGNKPNAILGAFVAYLLERFSQRVRAVVVAGAQ